VFEWNDDLSVSVDQMDQEHQELLGLMRALKDVPEGDTLEAVDRMEALLVMTQRHFKEEESLLAKSEYQQLDMHKQIHNNLLGKMKDFEAQIKTGYSRSLKRHITIFLEAWIIVHIKSVDRQYGPFLQGKH